MGALMRSMDWSKTPIGPVESWSPTLRMMVRVLLVNRFQLFVWWGPTFCQLYNDASRFILGEKHPQSMGQPASECWREIWHTIGPLIEKPFRGGEASWMEDIFLEMNRCGFTEETHFTVAYSPVPDDTVPSGIGGVLATVHEITEKIVGERRVTLLRDLGARSAEAKTAVEACAFAAETLAQHSKDVAFALIYLTDGDKQAYLAGTAGVDPGELESPLIVELRADSGSQRIWPLSEVFQDRTVRVVEDLSRKLATVPPGPWSDPPQSAVVLPIGSTMAHQPAGLLILGISSRLRFDDRYRDFCKLVASQVASAITNARAYEEEKERAEALAEIDRAKTAFFSNVSHEFRTPLTLMLGPVEDMLAHAGDSFTGRREELELVHRNNQRLLKLVNALPDFSRIEAGRMEAVFEPTDLAVLTTELVSVFRSAVETSGLRLSADCPTLSGPVHVDRVMWEKIVLNLISNAFKFTFEGEIAVSLLEVDQRVELIVSDTGIGIAESELPRIFDRFHRVQGARGRTFEGSGIGLALVQELAKLHGGSVRVESIEGRGSRFTVSIPLGQAHLADERVSRREQSVTVGAKAYMEGALQWLPNASGKTTELEEASRSSQLTVRSDARPVGNTSANSSARILFVDDNSEMREYVRRLLADSYEVQAVDDGEAALAAVHSSLPDLVLTDVMMPRLDGFGLLQALRADPRTQRIPVIVLSARAGEESRVEGIEAGADDYLIKPFSARELLARVSARLEVAKLNQKALRRERELRETAEALGASEECFRRYFELGLIGMAITSPTKGCLEVNDEICKILGYSRSELLRMTWAQMTHPDDVAADVANFDRVMKGETDGYSIDKRWIRKDGQVIHTTISVKCLRLPDGTIDYFLALLQDISERKRAEEALAAAHNELERRVVERTRELSAVNKKLRREIAQRRRGEEEQRKIAVLVENSQDFIGFASLEGQPHFLNPAGRTMVGLGSAAEVLTTRGLDYVMEDDRKMFQEEILPIVLREGHWEGELRFKHFKTGAVIPLHQHVFLINEPGTKRSIAIATIARDITERKRSEESLRAAQSQLAHMARVATMGEMAASIAHEVNQPLTAVVTSAGAALRWLGQSPPNADEARIAITEIVKQGHRASDVIARIRALVRKSSPCISTVGLNRLIEEVLILTRHQVVELGVRVRRELAADIPPISGDSVQLQQVLMNLILNAIEATVVRNEGARELVLTSKRRGANDIVIAVHDSGTGIDPQHLDQLFEPFFTTKSTGIGMGLAISRSIVEAHGGRLWATSNEKFGATFQFSLPVPGVQ
jgi:PAS domain S-box-containing protein